MGRVHACTIATHMVDGHPLCNGDPRRPLPCDAVGHPSSILAVSPMLEGASPDPTGRRLSDERREPVERLEGPVPLRLYVVRIAEAARLYLHRPLALVNGAVHAHSSR